MDKTYYFKCFYELYSQHNVLLNNTQLIFFEDIFPQLTSDEQKFYNKSADRIKIELEEDLSLLKESEEAKERAENNYKESLALHKELKEANDKLNSQNQEILDKLKSEQEFNKDFERIKAQNKLAATFLYVVTFLIVCIIIVTLYGVHNINEEQITSTEKTDFILTLVNKTSDLLKDLLLLLIGILSAIFAQMFGVPNQIKNFRQKGEQ